MQTRELGPFEVSAIRPGCMRLSHADGTRQSLTARRVDAAAQGLQLAPIAPQNGCTMAQFAFVWVLAHRDDIVPIPGTTRLDHLEENFEAMHVRLDEATLTALDDIVRPEDGGRPLRQSRDAAGERHGRSAKVEKWKSRIS